MNGLISTEALAAELGSGKLRLLDASWHMPAEKRDARAEFDAAHLPDARFFDIDAVSDRASPYPHMLPGSAQFARSVEELGIRNEDAVVVYDSSGLFSAPRAWWMFRVFGHGNVRVLDGGLPKWLAEGRAVTNAFALIPSSVAGAYRAAYHPELIYDKAGISANVQSRQVLVVDARSPGRFEGSEPEPRPGLRSGHIPGSVNLFFKDCLDPPFNTLKDDRALSRLLEEKGIDPMRPLAVTCGSGVTACILALALYRLGNRQVAVYDGAWAEWAAS